MKFKKDGNVFSDIEELRCYFCSDIQKGDCSRCPLYYREEICDAWGQSYPTEAALLMGYEVVEDEPLEKNRGVGALHGQAETPHQRKRGTWNDLL